MRQKELGRRFLLKGACKALGIATSHGARPRDEDSSGMR